MSALKSENSLGASVIQALERSEPQIEGAAPALLPALLRLGFEAEPCQDRDDDDHTGGAASMPCDVEACG